MNYSALVEEDRLDDCIWLTEDQVDQMLEDQRSAGAARARARATATETETEVHHRQKRKIEDFENKLRRKWTVMPIRYKFDGKHGEFRLTLSMDNCHNSPVRADSCVAAGQWFVACREGVRKRKRAN